MSVQMLIAIASMAATAQPAPWENDPIIRPAPERLGPGPHTLVISDGKGMTRMEYKTGAACKSARDSVRQQVIPPPIGGHATLLFSPPR